MWTIALTLRATLERADTGNISLPDLRRLNYSDMRPVKDAFMKTIEDLGFVGVSVGVGVDVGVGKRKFSPMFDGGCK